MRTFIASLLIFVSATFVSATDLRIQYSEPMVGANYPANYECVSSGTAKNYTTGVLYAQACCTGNQTGSCPAKTDTLNRLMMVEHNTDGSFKVIVDASNYNGGAFNDTTIAAAMAANPGSAIILRPGTPWIIANNLTITNQVIIPQGVILNIQAGSTITFSIDPQAGKYQIFSGIGSVAGLSIACPEWWGAKGDGITNSTAAIASAIGSQTVPNLYFDNGTYLTDTITGLVAGSKMSGKSRLGTVLKSLSGNTIVEVTGKQFHDFDIGNMTLQGNGGAGHGIYIHDNTYYPYNMYLHDLDVISCGGKGIYVPQEFGTSYQRIYLSGNGDNAIEVMGGTSSTLKDILVGAVATNKCGYRIYASAPLIGCNGITSGTNADWGIFGQTVAEDGVNQYSQSTLIGCNIENFTHRGIVEKSGSGLSFIGSYIQAPATGTVTAVSHYSTPQTWQTPIWVNSLVNTSGASWTNGYPFHGVGGAPFIAYSDQFSSYWDDSYGAAVSMSSITKQYSSYLRESIKISNAVLSKVDYICQGDFTLLTVNSTTPSLLDANGNLHNNYYTENTVATTITNFTNGQQGQVIRVKIEDNHTTLKFAGSTTFYGNAAADITLSSKDWFDAVYDGSAWSIAVHKSS